MAAVSHSASSALCLYATQVSTLWTRVEKERSRTVSPSTTRWASLSSLGSQARAQASAVCATLGPHHSEGTAEAASVYTSRSNVPEAGSVKAHAQG